MHVHVYELCARVHAVRAFNLCNEVNHTKTSHDCFREVTDINILGSRVIVLDGSTVHQTRSSQFV